LRHTLTGEPGERAPELVLDLLLRNQFTLQLKLWKSPHDLPLCQVLELVRVTVGQVEFAIVSDSLVLCQIQ
jgi:hypothetical protein